MAQVLAATAGGPPPRSTVKAATCGGGYTGLTCACATHSATLGIFSVHVALSSWQFAGSCCSPAVPARQHHTHSDQVPIMLARPSIAIGAKMMCCLLRAQGRPAMSNMRKRLPAGTAAAAAAAAATAAADDDGTAAAAPPLIPLPPPLLPLPMLVPTAPGCHNSAA